MALENFVPVVHKVDVSYSLEFWRDSSGGYSFPCDQWGNVDVASLQPAAQANYLYCRTHPKEFPFLFDHVHRNTYRYRENAHGTCRCGHEVELWDEYQGACQCEHCGQWYNMLGQELLSPDQWEEEDERYDDY